ncbi:hypothetical protein BJX70DRAFT_355435 [Aspergillus crustosus]
MIQFPGHKTRLPHDLSSTPKTALTFCGPRMSSEIFNLSSGPTSGAPVVPNSNTPAMRLNNNRSSYVHLRPCSYQFYMSQWL